MVQLAPIYSVYYRTHLHWLPYLLVFHVFSRPPEHLYHEAKNKVSGAHFNTDISRDFHDAFAKRGIPCIGNYLKTAGKSWSSVGAVGGGSKNGQGGAGNKGLRNP